MFIYQQCFFCFAVLFFYFTKYLIINKLMCIFMLIKNIFFRKEEQYCCFFVHS